MKYLISQFVYFLGDRQARKNLKALRTYLFLLLATILTYTILFHVIMVTVEKDASHSWLTGLYWTLVVMSTLGFGDITFTTDVGRLFSIVVLMSGIVMLLIMLPFAFIQYFYAPWIESRIRARAPRVVPEQTRDHVIICRYDSISPGLIKSLELHGIPYFVIEPDPVVAAARMAEEISVVTGELDNHQTYRNLRAERARMVFANAADTINTNIALTVREVNPTVPICAVAENQDSIDILELSGVTHVLELKQRLGEHLATRISAGTGTAQVVGRFHNLQIAEFLAQETILEGRTLREARIRESTGVNVVGVWERGVLAPVDPDHRFPANAVPVAIGTREQIDALNGLLESPGREASPVLIIGAGKVGRAAAAALELRGVPVHVVERDSRSTTELEGIAARIVIGDAADRDVLADAGLEEVSAVALTTNDDAVNIYLAIYCRRLRPDLNIVSRVTYERNVEAIYRAGADSVLSYATLGKEYIMARLFGRDPVMIGEGADLFVADVPKSLWRKSLGESGVGEETGLIVVAVDDGSRVLSNPSPETRLEPGARLLILGTPAQRELFEKRF